MFSSLDRVDIVLKADAEGRQRFVQTDHRTADEVSAEPELSALFALIRVLAPRRLAAAGSLAPTVCYSSRERPPEFLRRVIAAAGGQLLVGDDIRPEPFDGEPPPLDEVVQATCAELARATAAEFGVSATTAGLADVETRLAAEAGDPEESEIEYWSAVLKLGTFGGEIIRAGNGGRWQVLDLESLPLALATRFRGEEAIVNPLGKAIKRFDNGPEDSLVALVGLVLAEP